jgi:hypothetical protein
MDLDWGSVGQWVSGVGALTAAVVALLASRRAQRIAIDARQAQHRDRIADLLIRLIAEVEQDFATRTPYGDSVAARSLCRALWGHRNVIALAWHLYCEPDHTYTDQLQEQDQLLPQIRDQLQTALDSINYQDSATPTRRSLWQRMPRLVLPRD